MGKFERRKRKLEHSFRTLCKHSNSNFPKCQMREVAESLPWITTTLLFSFQHLACCSLQAPAFKISTLAWNLSTTFFSDMFSPNKPSNKHTFLNGAQKQKEKNVPGSTDYCLVWKSMLQYIQSSTFNPPISNISTFLQQSEIVSNFPNNEQTGISSESFCHQ